MRALERAQGEDQEGELVSVLLGEASSGTVRAEPKADAGTATEHRRNGLVAVAE